MGQKKSEFDKVFSAWDILVIAFGAMIGWGWVVSSGTWIDAGGVVGAALAFAIGGVMIFFVGLTYAELTAAMPQCGGEHVFSYKAMGATGSLSVHGQLSSDMSVLPVLRHVHFQQSLPICGQASSKVIFIR